MSPSPTRRLPSSSGWNGEKDPDIEAQRSTSDPYRLNSHTNNDNDELHLSKTQTISGMTISPELFEKLYLTPKVPHVGDNYKRFANPTPMGFVGFVISTFTFAMVMMGWGGASGLAGVAGIFFVCSSSARE